MIERATSVSAVSFIAAVLLTGSLGYAAGRSTTISQGATPTQNAELTLIGRSNATYGNSPVVRDAIRRWTLKNGGTVQKAMAGYQIQVIDTPTTSCIKFAMVAFDVGGEPTYCYAAHSTRLVWENSDVE